MKLSEGHVLTTGKASEHLLLCILHRAIPSMDNLSSVTQTILY